MRQWRCVRYLVVGDGILPHTLMHSHYWITKSHGRLIDAATAREETNYVRTNPHTGWLREIFELANIRDGRIDYGLRNGQPQVWEINTNPAIIRRPGGEPISEEQTRLRDPVRQQFVPNFQAEFEAIDSRATPANEIDKQLQLREERLLHAG